MAAIPAALLFMSSGAEASHQWSNYHWERDGVAVRDVTVANMHDTGSNWDSMFGSIIIDWNNSAGANFAVREPGPDESADVESFNADYGKTGWLGLAQIWISRGKYKHITRGRAHENDYYTNELYFDETTEQKHVICQEIGHTFGLDHSLNRGLCY